MVTDIILNSKLSYVFIGVADNDDAGYLCFSRYQALYYWKTWSYIYNQKIPIIKIILFAIQ